MREITIAIDEYKRVGPVSDIHGHDPVTVIDSDMLMCMECGYTTDDMAKLKYRDCDRSANDIPETYHEQIESGKQPFQ